ncbi:hypothetical protein BDE02_04G145200 [Populus trichocarpa]|nr:hypothetical protein BDE02_04G145200 [Populus trichocarpa]
MNESDTYDKASWTKAMLHMFCDICIKAIKRSMRPNTYFNKAGWKFVIQTFKKQTRLSLTKAQLKNKCTELGTISAIDEWWKEKIQEMKGAKKFRHVGIEPSLCAKYDIMFSNIVATRQYFWTPSQELLSDKDNKAIGMRNTTNEKTNIEEGSGDSEEDAIPDFIHNVSTMRGIGMRAQFFDCLDQLVKLVSIARESTTVFRDKKGCNIEEVMEELHSIDGVNFDNTLHTFAIEFFCARSKR